MGRFSVSRRKFNQLFASVIGNLTTLSYGILFGSTAPMLALYESSYSPLMEKNITKDQSSWVTSYLCIGGIIGTPLFGYLADRCGRRTSLIISCGPQIIGWLCVAFGYKLFHIYLSRFLIGLAAGCSFTILPIYITELAEDKIRGSLGSLVSTFRNLGIVIGFVIGSYIEYDGIGIIGLAVSTFFALTFAFMPETPHYFLMTGNMESLAKSLRWFRGITKMEDRSNPEYLNELQQFENSTSNMNVSRKTVPKSSEVFKWPIIKAFLIGVVLVTGTQFCGVFALLNYASTLFAEIAKELSPNTSALILAILQFSGAYIATMLSDRVGRKVLIWVTALISGVSLLVFGGIIFYRRLEHAHDNNLLAYALLICLCLTVFIANVGLYPMAFVVIAEIFPQNIKAFFITIFLTFLWFLAFLSVRYFYMVVDHIGIHGAVWIFAGVCLFECVFTIMFIPETRGRSLINNAIEMC